MDNEMNGFTENNLQEYQLGIRFSEKYQNSPEYTDQKLNKNRPIPELDENIKDMLRKIELADWSVERALKDYEGVLELLKVKQAHFYGVTIQESLFGEWVDQPFPAWDRKTKYRIKP